MFKPALRRHFPPEKQEAYYRLHPFNVIRLILNRELPDDDERNNRYTRARDLLSQWRRQGILKYTQRPSFWVYEQEFDIPEIGRRKLKGFIGLVRLQDCERGLVLPHEKILTRPLEDQIRLTQLIETQFEYIWGLYQDKAYVIDNLLDAAEQEPAIIDFYEQETFVRHRMRRLVDPEACRRISATMERLKIYIADGHHRYQAMLTIRDRQRALHPQVGPEAPWEYIMMFPVNSEHEGLTILPTHRLLHDLDLKRRSLADLNLAIQEHFHVKSYPFNGANEPSVQRRWLRDLRDAEPGVHKFGALIAGLNRYFLITLKDAEEALEAVRGGRMQAALILNSTRLEDIFTIAQNRERMPRKSTHFYPKPLSGLVFYPMNSQ